MEDELTSSDYRMEAAAIGAGSPDYRREAVAPDVGR